MEVCFTCNSRSNSPLQDPMPNMTSHNVLEHAYANTQANTAGADKTAATVNTRTLIPHADAYSHRNTYLHPHHHTHLHTRTPTQPHFHDHIHRFPFRDASPFLDYFAISLFCLFCLLTHERYMFLKGFGREAGGDPDHHRHLTGHAGMLSPASHVLNTRSL